MIQTKYRSLSATESPFHPTSVHPPVHLETVGGQAHVQAIAHVTVFGAAISVANRAEFGDVEVGVAAQQGIVRPGDEVETLVAHHLPLGAFEGKAEARITPLGADAQDMGTMLEARPIGRGIEAGKTPGRTDQFLANECAQQQAAIVHHG
jgi:hypothetical protein